MVLEGYRDEIALVFGEASREIAELPKEVSDIGQALLSRSNPLASGGGTNAISYLLPYWVQEPTGVSVSICRDLAVGNLYAMLHYFILDDAMDGGTGRLAAGLRRSLVLGQLLQEMYREKYAKHFSNESPIWRYDQQYQREWAAAVCRDGETPADPRDRAQLAGKAAPVKLWAVALLIQAEVPERIGSMEEAVELALAILQLSDDWTDWREDLSTPHCNAFLTIVRERLELSSDAPLDERAVRQAIFRSGCVNTLADITEAYAEKLEAIPHVPPKLAAFGIAIARSLRDEAIRIEKSVHNLALEGGLSNFLSNLPIARQ